MAITKDLSQSDFKVSKSIGAYLFVIFLLIYLIPFTFKNDLLSFERNGKYFISVFFMLVVFAIVFVFIADIKTELIGINKRNSISYLLIFVLAILSAYFFSLLLGFKGLTNRDEVRSETSNFTGNSFDFIFNQLSSILVAISSYVLSYSIWKGRLSYMFGSLAIVFLIFFYNGTRWNLLLGISPLLIYVLIISRLRTLIFISTVSVLVMLFISQTRGTNKIELASAIMWDIPSFQSKKIINHYDGDGRIIDFINGNFIVLVPRILWENKPRDETTEKYMISEIGDRYFYGATVLPGFLGSAYLYGGVGGVMYFTSAFCLLFGYFLYRNSKINGPLTFAELGLFYIGFVLQIRGISIFYLMPFFFLKLIRFLFKTNV